MQLSEFIRQPRGPYRFDTWLWNQSVKTELGFLPVELCCDTDKLPGESMVNLASELVAFARGNGSLLLDLIYGHYRYFEANGWLQYWHVPAGLAQSEIMDQVETVILSVHADLFASVHVDPRWDPEHKLCLSYDGTIAKVNDAAFVLNEGVLTFK